MRDEARAVPGNLRFGRTISGLGLGDSASLAQPIDLDDIGRDAALGRLPDETGRKAAGQRQTAERHQSPVAGLRTGGPDPLVPDLAGALIGRLRLRGSSVSLDRRSEEHTSELQSLM